MDPKSKIFVAGHRGLVGSAIVRRLQQDAYNNLILRTHDEVDLTDSKAVAQLFSSERPEYVFLAAAKVGGILANNTYPAEFIQQNLAIQTNVIHQSYLAGVRRLLFLGSSCIYPKGSPQPIKEEYLMTGPVESTNRPYAIAKIAGIEMCWGYNRQYGTRYLAAMPTNLYGPGDNYDLNTSHVIPALIRRIVQAKQAGLENVEVWGTGTPRREFLFSDDMADACVFLMNLPEAEFSAIIASTTEPPLINVGYGRDQSISELASGIAELIGYSGSITFDRSRPDGAKRKLLDISRLTALGWKAKTNLRDGLELALKSFLSEQHPDTLTGERSI